MVKKRRGRKATGLKRSAVFSTRMDPELKRRIEEAAAKNSGGNLTRELDKIVRRGLSAEEKQPDSKIRALSFFIGEAADLIGLWDTDVWSFNAFKAAINHLLETNFKPDDPQIIPPPGAVAFKEIFAPLADDAFVQNLGPERFGEWIAIMLWRSMLHSEGMSANIKSNKPAWVYAMVQAREALGIPPGSNDPSAIENYLAIFGGTVKYVNARNKVMAEQTLQMLLELKQRGEEDENDRKEVADLTEYLASLKAKGTDK